MSFCLFWALCESNYTWWDAVFIFNIICYIIVCSYSSIFLDIASISVLWILYTSFFLWQFIMSFIFMINAAIVSSSEFHIKCILVVYIPRKTAEFCVSFNNIKTLSSSFHELTFRTVCFILTSRFCVSIEKHIIIALKECKFIKLLWKAFWYHLVIERHTKFSSSTPRYIYNKNAFVCELRDVQEYLWQHWS